MLLANSTPAAPRNWFFILQLLEVEKSHLCSGQIWFGSRLDVAGHDKMLNLLTRKAGKNTEKDRKKESKHTRKRVRDREREWKKRDIERSFFFMSPSKSTPDLAWVIGMSEVEMSCVRRERDRNSIHLPLLGQGGTIGSPHQLSPRAVIILSGCRRCSQS